MQYNRGILDKYALQSGTDKSSKHHDYCRYYEPYLRDFQNQPINVLEIGVGGDEDENRGGESLKMWYKYFSKAKIIGVDITNKKGIINDRTKFYQMSQDDKESLTSMIKTEGTPSVIIDDASHISPLTIKTFEILFPLLASGGIYIVEDLETSYWEDLGYKGNKDPKKGKTIVNYLKELVDATNSHCYREEFRDEYSSKIDFIHFFKQTCIIRKV